MKKWRSDLAARSQRCAATWRGCVRDIAQSCGKRSAAQLSIRAMSMKSCGICARRWPPKGAIAMPAISKSARVCETCGSPMETTSSGDLGCMVCLLDAALDAASDDSNVDLVSTPEQFGAYAIERHPDGSAWELGHGAMGVTYR